MGKPYIDALGRQYGNMLGQPMLVFQANLAGLQKAHKKGIVEDISMEGANKSYGTRAFTGNPLILND
ncbi:DUF2000 family protein [Aeromonas caviae]|nr:DUF2000 family protein [Aeromonas caviae]